MTSRCRSVAYLLGVAMVLGGLTFPVSPGAVAASPAVGATAVVGEACSPNDAYTAPTAFVGCIAERIRSSRSGLDPACLVGVEMLPPNPIYTANQCQRGFGRRAEAIAQARLLARLNKSENGSGSTATSGAISRNLQWEVRVPPGSRIDVMRYDAADPDGQIELVELKQRRYGSAQSAEAQLDRYLVALRQTVPTREVLAMALDYDDRFRIIIRPCPPGGGGTRVVRQFLVSARENVPGIVMVDSVDQIISCPAGSTGEDIPDEVPVDADQFRDPPLPLPLPAPGRDENGNGSDDLWDEFFAQYPEFEPVPVPVPTPPAPAGTPVALPSGVAELIASLMSLGFEVDHLARTGAYLAANAADTAAELTAGLLDLWLTQFDLPSLDFRVHGDPHLVTLDGLDYSLQTVGEFDLLADPDSDLAVQARFVPAPLLQNASVLSDVAAKVGASTVEIGRDGVVLDGQATPMGSGEAAWLEDGALVVRTGQTYAVLWPRGAETFALVKRGSSLALVTPTRLGSAGLLGGRDGDHSNDLALRDGTEISTKPSQSTLYGAFADSWRIAADASLFTYPSGESTETYTDRAFPSSVLTMGDFSDAEIEAATASCAGFGVEPGPQFENCVFDVVVTGDDAFAADAALIDTPIIEAGARTFDMNGELVETFEGVVAPNFRSSRYQSDPATSTLAGPVFDGGGYRFYARDVPRHDELLLQFDLLTYRSTNSTGVQSVAVEVDGADVGVVTFDGGSAVFVPANGSGISPTFSDDGSGTVGSQTFNRVGVSLNLNHAARNLNVELRPSGFRGVLGTALGVDDISVSLTTPPSDEFSAALPFATTPAALGNGAGDLATPGSGDEYVFALNTPLARGLALDLDSCVEGLRYTIMRGSERIFSATGCGAKVTPPLDAGSYALQVTGAATQYTLQVRAAASPQVFDYTIGASVTEGVPSPGAGFFEDAGAIDEYIFTVPSGGQLLQYDSTAGLATFELRNANTGFEQVGVGDARFDLPAGEYTLTMTGASQRSYGFRLFEVPPPDEFIYEAGDTVSIDDPGPGAGRIETAASIDRYHFTAPAGGATYDHDVVGATVLSFDVVRAFDQHVVLRTTGYERFSLPAGDYYLEYRGPVPNTSGSYSFRMNEVAPPQVFEYVLGSRVSNGVPASGAGNLESSAATDQYLIEVPAGAYGLRYNHVSGTKQARLIEVETGDVTLFSTYDETVALPPGGYVLEFGQQSAGTYSFELLEVPMPQVFDYPLNTVVSDGVPWAGAGRFESAVSIDLYKFALHGDQTVLFDKRSGTLRARVLDASGAVVSPGTVMFTDDSFTLPAGEYVLEISYNSFLTYSFSLGS